MRLLPEDEKDDSMYHQGQICFDDGGMRGLAAALTWCGLLHHVAELQENKFCVPAVKKLAQSLLQIPTYYKVEMGNEGVAMIRRIIKQNVDSKVLSISSWEWASILASMSQSGQSITMAEAIEMYNGSAEIVAHGGSGSKDWRWFLLRNEVMTCSMQFVFSL